MSLTFALVLTFVCLAYGQFTVDPNAIFASCTTFAVHSDSVVSFDQTTASTISGGVLGANSGTVTGQVNAGGQSNINPTPITATCAQDKVAFFATLQNANQNCTNSALVALDGQTLNPGVYCSPTGFTLAQGSTVTLNGGGNNNAQFFLVTSAAINFGSNSNIVLSGGTQAKNVFIITSSTLTVGSGSSLQGNFIVTSTVSIATSTVNGRVLSKTNIAFTGGASTVNAFTSITNSPVTNSPVASITNSPTSAPTVDQVAFLNTRIRNAITNNPSSFNSAGYTVVSAAYFPETTTTNAGRIMLNITCSNNNVCDSNVICPSMVARVYSVVPELSTQAPCSNKCLSCSFDSANRASVYTAAGFNSSSGLFASLALMMIALFFSL